jgi:Peptidase family M28
MTSFRNRRLLPALVQTLTLNASRGLAARRAVLAISLLVLGAAGGAQKVQFVAESKAAIVQRSKEMPATDLERAARIKKMFADAGCADEWLREQPVAGADTPNVICELPGGSDEVVIVGAHYDRISSAERPIDNWSGASLLPALCQSLRGKKRRHTFIFVAFADKGVELAGAEFFAGQMTPADLRRTEAMVNLDVLGLSPTKVWTSHSDKDLVHNLLVMAYALKLTASQIDREAAGSSDSEPFASRQIPQITIHSLTQQNLADGATTPFRPNNYYDTYNLLCGYLAYLDTILKPRPNQE